MKILWVLGPVEYKFTGIHLYSSLYINYLREKGAVIDTLDIPYPARSMKRYLFQYICLPIMIYRKRKYYETIILYQEFFAYLIPILKLLNKKVFLIYHHVPFGMNRNIALEKIKYTSVKLLSVLVKYCDVIIVPSNLTRRKILSVYNVSESKISVVYNPFKPNVFKPLHLDEKDKKKILDNFKIKYGKKIKYLLCVGSEESRKNFRTLLETFILLKNEELVLIKIGGPIIMDNRLRHEHIVKINQLPVFFINKISLKELVDFYNICDVYLSPSLYEGFGRTVIEAQLCGRPVIASKIDAYEEVLRDSAFWVNDVMSPGAWEKAIHSVLNNNDLLRKLTEKSHENAKRFQISETSRGFDKLIYM